MRDKICNVTGYLLALISVALFTGSPLGFAGGLDHGQITGRQFIAYTLVGWAFAALAMLLSIIAYSRIGAPRKRRFARFCERMMMWLEPKDDCPHVCLWCKHFETCRKDREREECEDEQRELRESDRYRR